MINSNYYAGVSEGGVVGHGEGEAVCLPASMKGRQSEGKMEKEREREIGRYSIVISSNW